MKVGKHLTEREILLENEWVEEAKADIRKFSRLYDRYFGAIFNFIYRRTEDEDETADLASQTFYKAMQNISKYEFRGLPFSAWLFRIAVNEVNRHFRDKGRSSLFSVEEEKLRDLMIEESHEAIREEQLKKVLELLRDAPTEVVEILELRFFEQRSFKEISYILNISESGAKMRTYRAIERIKSQIRESS